MICNTCLTRPQHRQDEAYYTGGTHTITELKTSRADYLREVLLSLCFATSTKMTTQGGLATDPDVLGVIRNFTLILV